MRYRALGLAILAVFVLAVTGIGGIAAQEGTPAPGGAFADLAGVTELVVTLTDAGLEGLPAETAAGWHVVTFTNAITPSGDSFEDAWAVDFIQIPAGMTLDDVAAAIAAPPEGEASPEAMDGMEMASPEAGAAPEDPFAFFYEAYLAGGPGALQGETGEAAVYLEPGDYAVAVLGFSAPVGLTVTGAAEASPVAGAVAASATITETGTSGSFDFSVDALPAGPSVIEIVNESDQPHFIFAFHSPDPGTEDQVLALLESDGSGTPPAGALDLSQISPGFITGNQSPGTTQYVAVDLEPGYYALLCFIPDPLMDGVPHTFAGMIEIVAAGM